MLFYHWFYGELRGELGRELAAGLGPRRLVEALEEASSRARFHKYSNASADDLPFDQCSADSKKEQ